MLVNDVAGVLYCCGTGIPTRALLLGVVHVICQTPVFEIFVNNVVINLIENT